MGKEGGVLTPQQKMPVESILVHCPTQPWGNGPKRPGGQGMDSDSTDRTVQSCQDGRVSHEGSHFLLC